jgi:hypothetical protein
MAASQSISDLEYQAYLAANPGSKLSLADFKFKALGGPSTPPKSVTDLEYASLPATTPPPGSLADRKFKSLGGPSIPPQSLSDLKYATGGGTIPVPPFDPNTITGLQVWFKSDGTKWKDAARTVPAVADGDAVAVWDDSSPNARHASNATGTQQPTLKLNQLNGKSSVLFNAAAFQKLNTVAGFLNAQPITVFLVMRPTANAANYSWIGCPAGSAALGINGGKLLMYAGASNNKSAGNVSIGSPHILVWNLNGVTSKAYIEGGVPDPGAGDGATALNGMTIGAYASASSADTAPGDIFEVLAYNKTLSLAELDSIGNYLATKYGIAWAPSQDPVVAPGFDPSTIAGIQGWWAADNVALANGALVPQWNDLSGLNHVALQGTPANQPTLKTNQINGKPTVSCGPSSYLTTAALPLPGNKLTMFIVGKQNVGGASKILMSKIGGGNPKPFTWQVGGSDLQLYTTPGSVPGSHALGLTPSILTVTWSPQFDTGLWINGVADGNGNTGNPYGDDPTVGLTIGGGVSAPSNYDFAEILVYNAVLSVTDVNKVGNYLATKYGLAWTNVTFNPLIAGIGFHSAFWAEDPMWAHPADGVAVPSWRDGSGNARNMAQATGAKQPLYRAVAAGLNNRPAVQFDGVDDFMSSPIFAAGGQPFSLVVVSKFNALTSAYLIEGGPGGQLTGGISAGGSGQPFSLYAGGVLNSPTLMDQVKHFLHGVANGATSKIGVDGVETAGNAGTATAQTQWTVGSFDGTQAFANAHIAFAGFYYGDITTHANWAAFKAQMATLYGLVIA